jgi:alkylhydroperoxidase family enzyme
MTPLLLLPLLLAPADPPPPSDEPKPVPATREEEKGALEAHKQARPRLPMPPPPAEGQAARVNNGRFREFYLGGDLRAAGGGGGTGGAGGGGGGRDADPGMSLDPTFKVKLFWVTSRANNCYYCLGHQELKLAAAGVSDDDIAALDGDWARFTPAERAALAFTRKLTFEPNAVSAADVEELKRHYTPLQVLEIVVTVAGYNSTNRWTGGLNIPSEASGESFRRGDGRADLKTFQTPTSPQFAGLASHVAPLPAGGRSTAAPAWPARPAPEGRADIEATWLAARTRTPLLPLADEAAARAVWPDGPPPNWARLLANFPKAGKGRVDSLRTAETKGSLSPRLKGAIAWVAARQDRAWYALAVARDRLKAVGLTDDQVFALDTGAGLPDDERAALEFARKLAAAPALVADADVEGLRKRFPDRAVAEIVHQVCTAAFFDRLTETARLPLDR